VSRFASPLLSVAPFFLAETAMLAGGCSGRADAQHGVSFGGLDWASFYSLRIRLEAHTNTKDASLDTWSRASPGDWLWVRRSTNSDVCSD